MSSAYSSPSASSSVSSTGPAPPAAGPTSHFELPRRLRDKAAPELLARDEAQFHAVATSLRRRVAELGDRLDSLRRTPGTHGTAALERDTEIHRVTAQLRLLQRFDVDVCLGRMVFAGKADPVYIGRIGLAAEDGDRLLVDWRTPAAAPFFSATLARPEGLVSRRRYRWSRGRVTDYWDESFAADGELTGAPVSLDDQSAFIASLGAARSSRMRDVLGTIQSDQDAIIRAETDGPLVVDGGPGTGKTVVALHRAAYLLYARPRIARRGGVLVIGPHRPYLDYVADVLPSLGEEGVRMCTLGDLVPEGEALDAEDSAEVARIKAAADPEAVLEAAVRLYEEAPAERIVVETPWEDVYVDAGVWREAFDSVEPGTPHNEARAQVWDALVEILHDRLTEEPGDDDVPMHHFRRALAQDEDLRAACTRAWPRLDPNDIVGDLWTVPAYARMCMPWLTEEQALALKRDEPRAWTVSDVPFLDAARRRIGDPDAGRRERRRAHAMAAETEERQRVTDDLIAADDSELQVMSMLRGQDLRGALGDEAGAPDDPGAADRLAGPFAHIVVDEAQELTDAQWRMVLARCPSRSLTVVGDRAQARHGFAGTWEQRLSRVGLDRVEVRALSVNYRTPAEVMAEAGPVIRAELPHANVPVSVRETGEPVTRVPVSGLGAVLRAWLLQNDEGTACVVLPVGQTVPEAEAAVAAATAGDRVRLLTPETAKGLEFDLVVLVEPDSWGESIEAAVDRYVAMTRSTRRLVVLGAG